MNCPACNAHDLSIKEKGLNFTFLRCSSCELIFAETMTAGDEEFYSQHEVYKYSSPDDARSQKLFFQRTPFFKKELKQIRSGGSLLDVGCGYGGLVSYAVDLGLNAVGIDFNAQQIEIGQSVFQLTENQIYYANSNALQEMISNNVKFDCICLFEVLEHVDDPRNLIQQAIGLLEDDGTILISCPNEDRLQPTGRVYVDYPPHHLTRWKPSTLQAMMERLDFTLCRTDFDFDLIDFLWVPLINRQAKRRQRLVKSSDEATASPSHFKKIVRKCRRNLFNYMKFTSRIISLPGKFFGFGTMGARYVFKRKV